MIAKLLAIASCLMLTACGKEKVHESFEARITFYTDSKKWGKKTASQVNAKEGVTVAASKSRPFGQKLYIPALKGAVGDGKFVVQDRGPAVEKKTATKGKLPVIDVYVSSQSKIKKLSSTMKYHRVTVHVIKQ